jgi:hypothetical protein
MIGRRTSGLSDDDGASFTVQSWVLSTIGDNLRLFFSRE